MQNLQLCTIRGADETFSKIAQYGHTDCKDSIKTSVVATKLPAATAASTTAVATCEKIALTATSIPALASSQRERSLHKVGMQFDDQHQ